MSEIKLNLTDAQQTFYGTTHGSIGDACVAALSAAPETITELEIALERYLKAACYISLFGSFHTGSEIDIEPWDAGIIVIDLAARIVASESSYSHPAPRGHVRYHDGVSATAVSVLYRVPEDWLFLKSIHEYECLWRRRRQQRRALLPLDASLAGR
jgi:hypothetical protein